MKDHKHKFVNHQLMSVEIETLENQTSGTCLSNRNVGYFIVRIATGRIIQTSHNPKDKVLSTALRHCCNIFNYV